MIQSFAFYDNYYELLDNLPRKDKLILLEAIVDYMFKGIEPNLTGLNKAIWINLKMPLDTSKKQSLNVQKRWNKKNTKEDTKQNTNSDTKSNTNTNTTDDTKKDTKRDTNNISYFYFLISNFIKENNYSNNTKLVLETWINYKIERKEKYTEIGFTKLLSQIKNNISKYSEQKVCDLIDECMASNYKGIIFDKLTETKKEVVKDEYAGYIRI